MVWQQGQVSMVAKNNISCHRISPPQEFLNGKGHDCLTLWILGCNLQPAKKRSTIHRVKLQRLAWVTFCLVPLVSWAWLGGAPWVGEGGPSCASLAAGWGKPCPLAWVAWVGALPPSLGGASPGASACLWLGQGLGKRLALKGAGL